MATSAFKSTTKRTPIGASSSADESASSNRSHRRSRSLSRFSRRLPDPASDFAETPAPRGRFVNTLRGSGFPEISLDDLAIEFFSPPSDSVDEKETERGRSSHRFSEISPATAATASSQRRGRSVSRQSSRISNGNSNKFVGASGAGRTAADANSRRRRSVSAVRCQISDSESDIDHSQKASNHANMKQFSGGSSTTHSLQKVAASSHRRLGRSLSQKDLSKSYDGYSSHSSAITDDEAKYAHSGKDMIEKTIRAVYAQKKAEPPAGDDVNGGLYEAMRKEFRFAVDEIKTELEQAMVRRTSALARDSCLQSDKQAVSTIRKNHAKKLDQSEKYKQDLLVEKVLEEQRGEELSQFVGELLPDVRSSAMAEKPLRARKRSNDRNRMSKRLSEEAEKYFEAFISNIEDTDFSSFDGERSDASSTLGVTKNQDAVWHSRETETFQSPVGTSSLPVEMDGVILPWLQWETSNNGFPLPSKNKKELPMTPRSILWDAAQEVNSAQDPSDNSGSICGSWSPGLNGPFSSTREDAGTGILTNEIASHLKSRFDMDRYLVLQREEELVFERFREQHRINSGGLLLCGSSFF